MTLIATFRSPLAIALCADSQETVTCYDENGQPYELRVTVQKISPLKNAQYEIAIAGAGHASLIEAFILRAERAVRDQDKVICTQQNPACITALHKALEDELEKFYARDVAACPDSDKAIKLFIAGCCPIAQQYDLWVSEGIVLREARSPELIGWENALYLETALRVSAPGMTISQAVLATIHTLTLAKQTSNYVRDPLSLAVINKDGIWMESADYIRRMEDRLRDYESQMNRLFLACSDTTVSVPDLEDQIGEFKDTALRLHRDHIDQQAAKTHLEDMFSNDPLRPLPPGPIIFGTKGLTVEHDRDKINEAKERSRAIKEQIKQSPRIVECSKCKYVFDVVSANDRDKGIITAPCPACGELNGVRPKNVKAG